MVKSEIVLSVIFLEDRAKTINHESKFENPNRNLKPKLATRHFFTGDNRETEILAIPGSL